MASNPRTMSLKEVTPCNVKIIYSIEAVSKRFPLTAGFKIKEDDNFNHRNTLRFSRIKI